MGVNSDLNEALSERVIGAIFEVSHTLGAGFLEKVYERALVRELRMRGMRVDAQLCQLYSGSTRCTLQTGHILLVRIARRNSAKETPPRVFLSPEAGSVDAREFEKLVPAVVPEPHDGIDVFAISTSRNSARPTRVWTDASTR